MHLVHLNLNLQLLHRRTVLCPNLQRNASCDVEYYTETTEVIWTSGENMKRPPAGNKTMEDPPAGTEALPASRIEFILRPILSGEVIRLVYFVFLFARSCALCWAPGPHPCVSTDTARTKPLVLQRRFRRSRVFPTSRPPPATDATIPKLRSKYR